MPRRVIVLRADSADELFYDALRHFHRYGVQDGAFLEKDQILEDILSFRQPDDPTSPDSGKLLLEASFLLELTNPRNRLIYSKSIDIFNLTGLWLYLISGSDYIHPIEFYNPVARNFLDNPSRDRLRANWGERIFGKPLPPYLEDPQPVDRIIKLLQEHPSTRRAVLPVFLPIDIGVQSKNLPCLAEIQFLVVDSRLDCFTTMRSQAVYGVMPYDLFLLTMLHEWVSVQTGIPLGAYYHYCSSAVIRENEIPGISNTIMYPSIPKRSKTLPEMPPMVKIDAAQRRELLSQEGWIRAGNESSLKERVDLPSYWTGFLDITAAKRDLSPAPLDSTPLVEGAVPPWLKHIRNAKTVFPEEFLESCISRIIEQHR